MLVELQGPPPAKLNLGCWGSYILRGYQGESVRCYKCQRFNHLQVRCAHSARCGVCSGSHPTEECIGRHKANEPTTAKCPNCGKKASCLELGALRGSEGCGGPSSDNGINRSSHMVAPSTHGGENHHAASNSASNSGNTALFPPCHMKDQPGSARLPPPGTPSLPRPGQVGDSHRRGTRPPPPLIPQHSHSPRDKMAPGPATAVAAQAAAANGARPRLTTPLLQPPRRRQWSFAWRHPRHRLQHRLRHRRRLAGAPRVP